MVTNTSSWDTYPHKLRHLDKHCTTEKQYKKILKRFGEELSYELITTGDKVTLPSRIGALQATKYKNKDKSVDYIKTKEIWGEYNKTAKKKKYVYFDNRITNDFSPKLFWYKHNAANFKNKSKWALQFTRPNIRPNSYNKVNPKVSLVPFFREKGYIIYKEYKKMY